MKRTKVLVYLSLLLAINVIFTRFLSFETPINRLSFGFIPIVFAAILFGPVPAGVVAALGDIAGFFLKPSGTFFPGFTISALAGGLIYGLFLYKKNVTVLRITLAVTAITLFVNLGLNTLWLTILTGKAAIAIITPRIIKSLLMLPVHVVTIKALWKLAGPQIQRRIMQ